MLVHINKLLHSSPEWYKSTDPESNKRLNPGGEGERRRNDERLKDRLRRNNRENTATESRANGGGWSRVDRGICWVTSSISDSAAALLPWQPLMIYNSKVHWADFHLWRLPEEPQETEDQANVTLDMIWIKLLLHSYKKINDRSFSSRLEESQSDLLDCLDHFK